MPPLAFLINRPRLDSCCIYYIFIELCFEFADLFEFEIRTVLWVTARNLIFFADTRDFKIWLVDLGYYCLNTYNFYHRNPFKGYDKL
jgi:hypothetical protein